MLNRYIVPICDIEESRIYNLIISATSMADCQDRLMTKFSQYSDSNDWEEFLKDLDNNDILIGDIDDVEEL